MCVSKWWSQLCRKPATGSSPQREENMAFGALHPQLAGRTGAQWNYQKIRTNVGKDSDFRISITFPCTVITLFVSSKQQSVRPLQECVTLSFFGFLVFFLREVKNKEIAGRSCTGWYINFPRIHFHFLLSCIGEGNGNPLQYSCLENPMGRGAR